MSFNTFDIQPHTYTATSAAAAATYARNLQNWSTTPSAPAPRTATAASRAQNRGGNSRSARGTPQPQQPPPTQHLLQLNQQQPQQQQQYYHHSSASPAPVQQHQTYYPLSVVKNTREQAHWSSYASRLRTGTSLLMQPIIAPAPPPALTGLLSEPKQQPQQQQPEPPHKLPQIVSSRPSRRAAAARVSYVDQGSSAEDDDDDDPDHDGEHVEEEFVTTTRRRRTRGGNTGASTPAGQQEEELTQSYLSQEPPERFLKSKYVPEGGHGHGARELYGEVMAEPPAKTSLIPISLSFNTPTHRVRDSFLWNIHESVMSPLGFARVMCQDLDLDNTYVELIAAQIETQIEEHLEVASADIEEDLNDDGSSERPECRVILSINVHIPPAEHLLDHIEWDLLSNLTPEEFAKQFCAEVGLGGESLPLITHALHEELLKHKKDAIEWGVLAGEEQTTRQLQLRDKTGLGLSSASAWTKGGPGPRALKSIWRDYAESVEFQTRLQPMTEEERERRELEGERMARRLRRETSKFQSAAGGRSSRRR